MTKLTTATRTRLIWAGLAVGAVLLGGGAWAAGEVFATDAEEVAADSQAQDAELKQAARMAIVSAMPQAVSVKFGATRVNHLGPAAAVCGVADIDEPDDGFEGPERFVYVDGDLTLETRDGDEAVAAQWKTVCEG